MLRPRFAVKDGCGDGRNERRGRFRRGLAVRLGPFYSLAANEGSARRELAGTSSVTGVVKRWQRHHEVSMLSAVAAEVGRCFGWQPAAKVSMMIMRPPRQRQGRGGRWGLSVAAVLDVSACCERDGTASNSRARAILAARLPLANNP